MRKERKLYAVIALLILSVFVMARCAYILSKGIKIQGTVWLSDYPITGHGGVFVQVGEVSTSTSYDGSFQIIAYYLKSSNVSVFLQKEGYEDKTVEIYLTWPSDSIIDIGIVTLQKLPE